MKNHKSIIDRLKKIKKLSEQGYKGEARQAQAHLQRLLEKHGLTHQDIEDNEKKVFYLKYTTINEEKLIIQIAAKFQLDSYGVKRNRKTIKEIGFETTAFVYAEIAEMYAWHRKNFKEELEIFKSAYISKHRLFEEKKSSDKIGEKPELTVKEKQRLWKIALMREGISGTSYKKQDVKRLL